MPQKLDNNINRMKSIWNKKLAYLMGSKLKLEIVELVPISRIIENKNLFMRKEIEKKTHKAVDNAYK